MTIFRRGTKSWRISASGHFATTALAHCSSWTQVPLVFEEISTVHGWRSEFYIERCYQVRQRVCSWATSYACVPFPVLLFYSTINVSICLTFNLAPFLYSLFVFPSQRKEISCMAHNLFERNSETLIPPWNAPSWCTQGDARHWSVPIMTRHVENSDADIIMAHVISAAMLIMTPTLITVIGVVPFDIVPHCLGASPWESVK